MSDADKAIIICLIGAAISFTITAILCHKESYNRGVRDGWHRGRNLSRQEFWEE